MKDIRVFSHIPEDLIELRRWLVWLYEFRINKKGERKRTKVPYNARTGNHASSTWPSSWSSYSTVLEAYRDGEWDGIGFALGDNWAGVDLDHCIIDGRTNERAERIINELSTYTEISPSGDGVKMIVRGELPPGRRKMPGLEMYDRGRFFTITGNQYHDAVITTSSRGAA